MTHPREILDQLKGHRIMVIGDVMLDRYLTGSVHRISPEAPVPVVLQHSQEDRLGGAANVALNLKALGAEPLLCSVIGTDLDGMAFKAVLPQNALSEVGMISLNTRRTTVKTRVLGNHQQMLRIDQEDVHPLSAAEEDLLMARVRELLEKEPVKAIILQDYNKGVLSPNVIARVLQLARQQGILTAVDPKKDNFFAYQGVDLFKPNLKEIRESAPFAIDTNLESLSKSAHFLQETLKNRLTMITLSEKGLYLNNGKEGKIYPTIARNIADVSGAGDTVISIAALALVAGLEEEMIATLSNLAGGQVCEFPGVVPVNLELLETELSSFITP